MLREKHNFTPFGELDKRFLARYFGHSKSQKPEQFSRFLRFVAKPSNKWSFSSFLAKPSELERYDVKVPYLQSV